ncbi:MAG: hypothetical protein A2143_04935 [Gallionellales bacterium RBG_16_57_15]|nr:MAG: hypothetical protein A2143_04935 [Gallionellales bacterium RBG_16_57_15]
MTPLEENCPIPSTHEKCAEARYFLVQCLLNYHSPQAFLYNLNAFIQAFRNITFMLQSEELRPHNFLAWYEVKQNEMRNMPTLRRLVDARNIVVKQSSLTAKSKVMCGLFRGRRMKLSMGKEVKPFIETKTILEATSKYVGEFFLGGRRDIIGEQAGVERTWIVEELGEGEVIEKCIEAINYMIALVDEAHQLSGNASGLEYFGIADMREFSVLLETDADPSLFTKWGWLES